MKNKFTLGFTFVEILIAIGISMLIIVMLFTSFLPFRRERALNSAVEKALATLEEARSLTLGSREDSVYGVHLAATSTTLFQGDTFVSGASTNKIVALDRSVTLSDITLSGGGDDVIFQRLTGDTNQDGFFVISVDGTDASTTITIRPTGIFER